MSAVGHFLLGLYILGCSPCGSWAWTVNMPSNIKAMLGSCVTIPCSFDYYKNPPSNPNRVVWYQYVKHGYPLVYDNWNRQSVIGIFRGKTSRVTTFRGVKECTLKISRVTWEHHRQRIYPWIDPENVGKGTYRFFDKTVTIEVTDKAETPDIMISGDLKVGESVTVQCSVHHSCFTELPTLSLNIPLRGHKLDTFSLADGTFKTTLTTKLNLEKDHQTVECSVYHTGGQWAKSSETFNAKCSFWPITIKSPDEFLEEQPSQVLCTAEYTCPQHAPAFKWSYGSMPAVNNIAKISDIRWRATSTLTFTASATDNGRSLMCAVQFTDSQRQEVSLTLRVKRTIRSVGWSFTTPNSVTGMKGSCVIIPCRFTYDTSLPADLRVIWYLFQGNQYSPVFDGRQNAISKYRGMTSLTGAVGNQECSLKIDKLDKIHGQDRLFPWIDKNAITFYHMKGHSFYDKTTQIVILDHAPEPQLSISNIPRVGEESKVTCSAQHTCFSSPPLLTISGILGSDSSTNIAVSEGVWEKKVERVWSPTEEDQSVKCTVRYPGGQTASSELRLNVECLYTEIRMTKPPGDAVEEGVAQSVICSVSYKCRKNTPTIVWNYSDMQSSPSTEKVSGDTFVARSNLTFIGSLDDDGKTLTCTAKFITGETSDSGTIRVKKYERRPEEENEAFQALAGKVPFRFPGLPRSCVVIPCSFLPQESTLITKGVWSKLSGGNIYHNAQSRVLDHFKGRTRILGRLGEGNCSLEIDDIEAFDNGPFCFHAEHKNQKYRFNNSCVFVVMKASPEKPLMTQIPKEVDAGAVLTVSCSVVHTCSSHPPEFSWSVSVLTREATHTLLPQDTWKTTSTITFSADGGDGEKNVTCTATYWRGRQQSSTAQLTVKGSLSFQLKSSLPVTIPVSVVFLIVIILAGVGIFKRKQSRRPPPRPEKRRSLWERLSRRQEASSRKPPRPEKRKSFWRRFSRSAEDHHVAWENDKKSRVEDITLSPRHITQAVADKTPPLPAGPKHSNKHFSHCKK